MNYIRNFLAIIALIGISVFGGIYLKEKEVLLPEFNSTALQIESKIVLVSQKHNFKDVYGYYKLAILGTDWVVYSWTSEQEYGITIPDDWDWGFSYKDREVNITAPKLIHFTPNNTNRKFEKISGGVFTSDLAAVQTMEDKITALSQKSGDDILSDPSMKSLAELSLEKILLPIIQEANPKLGILKVNVTFSS